MPAAECVRKVKFTTGFAIDDGNRPTFTLWYASEPRAYANIIYTYAYALIGQLNARMCCNIRTLGRTEVFVV